MPTRLRRRAGRRRCRRGSMGLQSQRGRRPAPFVRRARGALVSCCFAGAAGSPARRSVFGALDAGCGAARLCRRPAPLRSSARRRRERWPGAQTLFFWASGANVEETGLERVPSGGWVWETLRAHATPPRGTAVAAQRRAPADASPNESTKRTALEALTCLAGVFGVAAAAEWASCPVFAPGAWWAAGLSVALAGCGVMRQTGLDAHVRGRWECCVCGYVRWWRRSARCGRQRQPQSGAAARSRLRRATPCAGVCQTRQRDAAACGGRAAMLQRGDAGLGSCADAVDAKRCGASCSVARAAMQGLPLQVGARHDVNTLRCCRPAPSVQLPLRGRSHRSSMHDNRALWALGAGRACGVRLAVQSARRQRLSGAASAPAYARVCCAHRFCTWEGLELAAALARALMRCGRAAVLELHGACASTARRCALRGRSERRASVAARGERKACLPSLAGPPAAAARSQGSAGRARYASRAVWRRERSRRVVTGAWRPGSAGVVGGSRAGQKWRRCGTWAMLGCLKRAGHTEAAWRGCIACSSS